MILNYEFKRLYRCLCSSVRRGCGADPVHAMEAFALRALGVESGLPLMSPFGWNQASPSCLRGPSPRVLPLGLRA